MNIPKIRDRIFLGMLVGVLANIPKVVIDDLSGKFNISQRSFRETAAGVLVSTQKQATTAKGHLLGNILDFGMAMFGGTLLVKLFSKTGRDHVILKGLFFGIGMGSILTGLLNGPISNKVGPKNAASNLSYVASHAAYGIVAACLTVSLGHPSLFDAKPYNDASEPTELTTEQIRLKEKMKQRQSSNKFVSGVAKKVKRYIR